MNYYERHIGDYIKDTVSLSMLEDGAYNRLIDQAYQTEEPLPLEKKEIYRLARATSTAERKAVDYVLNKFWQETEVGYVQKRIETEIERYQDKQRKAKASADARWNKGKSQSDGNANASQTHDANSMRSHSEGNAHQTPDTRHQTLKTEVDEGNTVVPIRTKPINQPQVQNKPPNHHDLTKFQMALDWKPSEQFETLARISGLVFPDKFPVTELGEFKTYWLTHDHQPLDQSQWEHKFIQNLLHLKARNSR